MLLNVLFVTKYVPALADHTGYPDKVKPITTDGGALTLEAVILTGCATKGAVAVTVILQELPAGRLAQAVALAVTELPHATGNAKAILFAAILPVFLTVIVAALPFTGTSKD